MVLHKKKIEKPVWVSYDSNKGICKVGLAGRGMLNS